MWHCFIAYTCQMEHTDFWSLLLCTLISYCIILNKIACAGLSYILMFKKKNKAFLCYQIVSCSISSSGVWGYWFDCHFTTYLYRGGQNYGGREQRCVNLRRIIRMITEWSICMIGTPQWLKRHTELRCVRGWYPWWRYVRKDINMWGGSVCLVD